MEIEIKGYKVLIDDEDWERVKQYSWRVCKKEEKQGLFYFHAATKRDPITNKQKDIRLHRLIIGCTVGDGFLVDHINHNTLDNRKCNLRKTSARGNVCNSRISSRNTSGYIGVSKTKNKWIAYIQCNKIQYYLGTFANIIEAAKARDKKAIELFGEEAILNFPKEEYTKELQGEQKTEN